MIRQSVLFTSPAAVTARSDLDAGRGTILFMETVSHTVGMLQPALRQAMETLVGHPLAANQKLVIQVLGVDAPSESGPVSVGAKLPAWCGVFTDLTAEEDEALTASIAGRTESRQPS